MTFSLTKEECKNLTISANYVSPSTTKVVDVTNLTREQSFAMAKQDVEHLDFNLVMEQAIIGKTYCIFSSFVVMKANKVYWPPNHILYYFEAAKHFVSQLDFDIIYKAEVYTTKATNFSSPYKTEYSFAVSWETYEDID